MFEQNQRSGDESLLPQEIEVKTIALALQENDAEAIALLESLKASYEDCLEIVLLEDDAWKLWKYAKITYHKSDINAIEAKPGQTELVIQSANTSHLKQGSNTGLPGGYSSIATKFKDNLVIYAFRYVSPGSTIGMRFDGLIFVKDKWVFIPKMWRAF